MTIIKTVDDVLDVNRKLLNVLAKRLAVFDVSEELVGQEFIYVSNYVSPDQLITTESDSAFVACSMMMPYRAYNAINLSNFDNPYVMGMENLSAGRIYTQGGDPNGTFRSGFPVVSFTQGHMNGSLGTNRSVYDQSYQSFFKEPVLLAPNTTVRFSYYNVAEFTLSVNDAFERIGSVITDRVVLLGYKIRLG